MSDQTFGELPPHWVEQEIKAAVERRNVNSIKRALCNVVTNSQLISDLIEEALEEEPGKMQPGAAHRVRLAVGRALIEQPEDIDV